LYGRYLKDFKIQNSEYRGHQVGPKDPGSQNFSFLAFKLKCHLTEKKNSKKINGNGFFPQLKFGKKSFD
jgi:hypothetical protein